MVRILFLSNNDGGFAQYEDHEEGTTVSNVLEAKGYNPADFMIRVNREEVMADRVLRNEDRLTITPVKIEGAA